MNFTRGPGGVPWLDDISVEHDESPEGYFRVALEFARGAELIHIHGAALMPIVVGASIAVLFGVTESRVCQLLREAAAPVRSRLADA